ncbi:hypothetical protein CHUAL_004800 [Chamberlinius hualienensis]
MATERIMSRSSSSCSDIGSIQEELDNGLKFQDKSKVDNLAISKSIRTAILNNNKNNNRLEKVNDNNSKNKTKDVALKKKIKTSKKTDRRDPERFLGEGIAFKAKLIGSQDVPLPRGEQMAQEALQDLKAQKKVSGEHKRRIVINITLEGLKIIEEKKKDVLYFHAVHKISFISQDPTDNRAFGYIYGSPDNVHTFFAIKTEKVAQIVVMCMRDLFQIAFELKKREIEQWRQQQLLTANTKTGQSTSLGTDSNDGSTVSGSSQRDTSSPISMDSSNSNGLNHPFGPSMFDDGGNILVDFTTSGYNQRAKNVFMFDADNVNPNGDAFFDDPWEYMRSHSANDDAVDDNMDPFEVESRPIVNSIAPVDPSDDPFNTNFVHVPFAISTSTPCIPVPVHSPIPPTIDDQCNIATTGEVDKYAALAAISSEISKVTLNEENQEPTLNESFNSPNVTQDFDIVFDTAFPNQSTPFSQQPQQSQQPDISSIFSELDPLGKDRPYVDKKDFFFDVKNPPKKVLKDLIAENTFSLPEFEITPSSQNGSVDTEEVAITSPPPSTLPPPLPPPFVRRPRVASPLNIQCSNLDGTPEIPRPNSRTSSSLSTPEVYLPPPPPPPPRPQHSQINKTNSTVLTSSSFSNSEIKTGCRDSVYSSSSSSDGSSSPIGDIPLCNSSSLMNSSPPIPIPGRRDFAAQSSISSSGISSAHNSEILDRNSCDVERPFSKWNQLSSSNPTVAILSPPPTSTNPRRTITTDQTSKWIADNNNNNNRDVDGHNSVICRNSQLQTANNKAGGIFIKVDDPFNDDEFFSALRPNNPFR